MPATNPDPDLAEFLASGPTRPPGLIPDVILPALFHADQAARQLPAAAAVADEHGVENLPSAAGTVEAVLRFLEEAITAARRADDVMTTEVTPRLDSVSHVLRVSADQRIPVTPAESAPLANLIHQARAWLTDPEAMALADKVR